jgi:hypothetical protein
MNMLRRTLSMLAVASLCACRGSDPQPLEFISGDAFEASGSILAGGGSSEFICYSRTNGFTTSLRLVRHRASASEQLEFLGDVEVPGGSYPGWKLFVGEAYAAVALGSSLMLVDLSSPSLVTSTLPFGANVLAIGGRWLLAGSDSNLILVDLSGEAPPSSFAGSSTVTSVMATQGSFLAFTTGGYVHVTPDLVSPIFKAVDHPVLRNFQAAFADGVEAVVAGRGATFGHSLVARIDLRSPDAPVVMRTIELAGEFAEFSWDGTSTSVLGIRNPPYTLSEGYVVREKDGAFSGLGIALPERFYGGDAFAAHAGHLFDLSNTGFGFYRIR